MFNTTHVLSTIALSCYRLAELNVIRQVFNICSSPTVQAAWDAGTSLTVHGLVYSLKDGLLKVHYLCSESKWASSLIKG